MAMQGRRTVIRKPSGNSNSFCSGFIEQMRKTAERQRITLGPKPRDNAVGAKRYEGAVAKFLALVDVRYVNFDDRRFEGVQCIEDRYRRVRESSRIDHDTTRGFSCLVDPVDDFVFTVRLMKAKLETKITGDPAAIGLEIGKSLVTVDMGLALADKVQVGSVQHVGNSAHGRLRDWQADNFVGERKYR